MKVVALALGLVVAVAFVLLNSAGASWLQTPQPGQTMPPGVGEEFWIPLSDRAGIVVSAAELSPDMRGMLFVEVDGQWVALQLVGDPRLRPLH